SPDAAQLADRAWSLRFFRAQIHLHDFAAWLRSGIRDLNARVSSLVGLTCAAIERDLRVAKRGVRQPVSECIQRLAFEVSIGAATHVVVVECRQTLLCLVE